MDSLPTFAKILVAIDGSDHAEKAFRHAMALAQKFGSQVVIANVMLPPVSGGAGPDCWLLPYRQQHRSLPAL